MTALADLPADPWEWAARAFEDPRPAWATPGDLAVRLDARTRQTPALDLIDAALVRAATTPDARQVVCIAPQEGKSVRISRRFPLWVLLQHPDTRIVIVSYEYHVARRWGRAVRDDIVANPELGLTVRSDLAAQHEWQLLGHEGGVYTTGIGGSLTGRPADLLGRLGRPRTSTDRRGMAPGTDARYARHAGRTRRGSHQARACSQKALNRPELTGISA